jgi:hypothetical protein
MTVRDGSLFGVVGVLAAVPIPTAVTPQVLNQGVDSPRHNQR